MQPNNENILALYEKAANLHAYFLGWRYKLIAGFIVIVSALGYFLITWENFQSNPYNAYYLLICQCGIIITILFSLIHYRITVLIWKSQNKAYFFEKKLTIGGGVYGSILHDDIRKKLDNNNPVDGFSIKVLLSIQNHTGATNWLFILVFIGFRFLKWIYLFQFAPFYLNHTLKNLICHYLHL